MVTPRRQVVLFQRTILDHIQQLDPNTDDQEIIRLTFFHEFPWDGTKSLEFALFRTYAVPSIGGLLDATGEFKYRTQKRYDDTDLLISTWVEHGYDSDLGRRAIRRMNQIHSHFAISNEDYLYVLSTFLFEPIRWMRNFAWRPMCEVEERACYVFWSEVGRRMGMHDIPESLEAFEAYNVNYERDHFRRNEASRQVAESTRDLFLGWYLPRPLWRLGAPAVYALMDNPLLEAFGFPKPSRALRFIVGAALRTRARIIRWLPERRTPKHIPGRGSRTYPDGYEIEILGAGPRTNLDSAYLRKVKSNGRSEPPALGG